MSNDEHLAELLKLQDCVASGYGGVDQFGRIVDRRVNPTAVPMRENSLLKIPKPKDLCHETPKN